MKRMKYGGWLEWSMTACSAQRDLPGSHSFSPATHLHFLGHIVTTVHPDCSYSHGQGTWANICWATVMHRYFIKHYLFESSTLRQDLSPPFQRLNGLPGRWAPCPTCSTLHGQRASPWGRFPDPMSAGWPLDSFQDVWQRTRPWPGGGVKLGGFPSSSLCREEDSRGCIPSEVPMAPGLRDQSAPSLHSTQREGFLLVLISG